MDKLAKRHTVEVLLSLAPPDGTTKYVVQLSNGAPSEIKYHYFSWGRAIFGGWDVFHIHWPEFLIRSPYFLLRWGRLVLFFLFLFRLKFSRKALVRTVHNINPHESGSAIEQYCLRKCDELTTLYIRLNKATEIEDKNFVTILHGHYIGRYPGVNASASIRGRILYFGLIRPYKGVEKLFEVFNKIVAPDLTLRIVGNPTQEFRALIPTFSDKDPRVSSLLKFVPDDILAQEIYEAELVVLPYKEMHNSGAILVALSLNRPVLVPRSKSNALLNEEVGSGWVYMYDDELTPSILTSTLKSIRSREHSALPNLAERDWSVVGEAHYQAYLKAIELKATE